MRRAVLALLIGAAVFGGIYGLAASLNVSTKSLGAGNTSVAACQSGTLTASYATAYSSTIPGYQVGVVTIAGIQSGCLNMSYRVTLVGSTNNSLGEVTGTTPGAVGNFSAGDFTSQNVPAASVTGVHIVVTG